MFTAASVMISGSRCPGTSMTKQWLIRRSVRMPVSRATTAAISSSVCRLPFISAAALPSRTNATALAAESWLCAASTIGRPAMSMPWRAATSRMRAGGPTRIGSIRRSLRASTAPPERHLVARMRHRGDDRRQLLRRVDQTQILVVCPRAYVRKLGRLVVHAVHSMPRGGTTRIDVDQWWCRATRSQAIPAPTPHARVCRTIAAPRQSRR